jgi:hypothetical protein
MQSRRNHIRGRLLFDGLDTSSFHPPYPLLMIARMMQNRVTRYDDSRLVVTPEPSTSIRCDRHDRRPGREVSNAEW